MGIISWSSDSTGRLAGQFIVNGKYIYVLGDYLQFAQDFLIACGQKVLLKTMKMLAFKHHRGNLWEY